MATKTLGLLLLLLLCACARADDAVNEELGGAYTPTATKESILRDHETVATKTTKTFEGETLGYVTPWNSDGFRVAEEFAAKFTMLAPVWYRIVAVNKTGDSGATVTKPVLKGSNEVNKEWIAKVKVAATAQGKSIKFTPRFTFEFEDDNLRSRDFQLNIAALIITECKKQQFDGIVFEISYIVKALPDLVKLIAGQLHKQNMILTITIAPIPHFFNGEDFRKFSAFVDYFSLMTYDFPLMTRAEEGAPNAPIFFVHGAVEELLTVEPLLAKKILLGLNFFGYDYPKGGKATAVLGHGMVDILLKPASTLTWHDKWAEHVVEYVDEAAVPHMVFYPTPDSIKLRVEYAQSLGMGVSIWELGQGLDFFYDLL